jgi:hypothetical protein
MLHHHLLSYCAGNPVLGKVVADVDGKGDEEACLQAAPPAESDDESDGLDILEKCCYFLQMRTQFWDDAEEYSQKDLEMLVEISLQFRALVADGTEAEVAQELVRGLLNKGLLIDAHEAEDGDEDAIALFRWSREACLAQYGDEMLARWPVSAAVEDAVEGAGGDERSLYQIGEPMV